MPTTANDPDFFERAEPPLQATVIVTNPPFSKKRQVLERLIGDWQLPFALVLPSEVLQRDYFLRLVQQNADDWHLSVLLPNKTLRFQLNGRVNPNLPPFKLAFFCGRPRDNRRRRCTHQRRRGAPPYAPVSVGLFDYEQATQ